MRPLDGVRVLDRTQGLAGPYCTKLLADAGADVVIVERVPDPMRSWRSGALFEYLNGGKRAVDDDEALLGGADVLVTDDVADVGAARVVVTITPFGVDGPWARRPATEFTLQAACGSIGQRGLPEQPPLAAGGRLGEWLTGTYAALGATAALRTNRAEHIDVAMLDCMAISMSTYPSVFAEMTGWPPLHGTGRTVEVPSIVPTADGWVVFTTNSATQFQDFLVQIGRADLLDDPDLPKVARRFERRDEFLTAVHEYTTKRTSVQVLEDAAAFRIPRARCSTARRSPSSSSSQRAACSCRRRRAASASRDRRTGSAAPDPRRRLRHRRLPHRRPRRGAVTWSPRTPADAAAASGAALRSTGCGSSTARHGGPARPPRTCSRALGADVIKIESVTRPDLMRYTTVRPPSDDRWWEWCPLFHGVNSNKRAVTLDLTTEAGVSLFERLAGTADAIVENYTPRVLEQFGLGFERLHEVNPRLVLVRMPAFGLDGPWRDRTGFAQTMESITGMAWLTGFPDGPPVLVRGAV